MNNKIKQKSGGQNMKIMFASFNKKNKLKRQDILNNISKYTSTMIDENRILKRTNRIKGVSK